MVSPALVLPRTPPYGTAMVSPGKYADGTAMVSPRRTTYGILSRISQHRWATSHHGVLPVLRCFLAHELVSPPLSLQRLAYP